MALGAGCSSSSSSSTAGDLAAPADLVAAPCAWTATGDATAAESCMRLLCNTGTYEELSLSSTSSTAQISVAGSFAVRSYAVADLRGFAIDVRAGGKDYQGYKNGTKPVVGSLALTVTALEPPQATCASTAMRGSATASLVEFNPSTGLFGSGSLTVSINF